MLVVFVCIASRLGWLFKIDLNDAKQLDALMDEEAYEKFCKEE